MEEIKVISAQETYPLRLSVLWPHFDQLDQCGLEVDKIDGTFHVGAFKGGELVSIGTFLVQKNEQFNDGVQYRLRAMATSEKVRGQGFGQRLIQFAKEELNNKQVDLLWCDARKVALKFYDKIGFTTIGDFYDVPQIGPHKLMYCRIK